MNTEIKSLSISKRELKKERELIKKTPAFIAFFTIMFIVLFLHAVSLIYPFIWLILNSLKTNYEYVSTSSLLPPQNWQFPTRWKRKCWWIRPGTP